MSQRAWIAQFEEPSDETTMSDSARATLHEGDGEDDGHPTRALVRPSAERNSSLVTLGDDAPNPFPNESTRRDISELVYEEYGENPDGLANDPNAETLFGDAKDYALPPAVSGVPAPLPSGEDVDVGDWNEPRGGEWNEPRGGKWSESPSDAAWNQPTPVRSRDEQPSVGSEKRAKAQSDASFDAENNVPAARSGIRPPSPRDKEGVWDAVEARYRDEGHWGDLVEMYLQRVEGTREMDVRLSLFKRIGQVMCEELEDPKQALDAYVEALLLDPHDLESIGAIESIAHANGWWLELFTSLKRELREVKDKSRELAICELAARWAREALGEPQRAEPFLERIRRIEPGHPAIQRRLASQYRDQGNWLAQRESLERAMAGAKDESERLAIQLMLGEINEQRFADGARAARHWETAIALDPLALTALLGLERYFRTTRRFADLVQVLEQQLDAAPDGAARVATLLRLAEVHEREFVRPQHAVPYLEEVVANDPAHALALEGLERCYHAMRAWPDLVRVLEMHVQASPLSSDQVELVTRVAEVLELQMGDYESAAVAWRRVWDLAPASEHALSELARLAERAQDWSGTAAYRAKLADLAGDPEASAKIHVAIGELLVAPGRDPSLARKHFEKAASIHPATTQAWEALEREARRTGDPKRAAMFLEKRAASTDSPRMKAQLFVELAQMHVDAGEVATAELSFERAIKADPTNEAAAEAMLAAHMRERRWADAQPLCELLVSSSTRDAGEERHFTLLRTATRIARELGQVDRAVSASLATWRTRPSVDTAQDLIDACYQARGDLARIAKAQPEIDAIADHAMQLPPPTIAQLARIKQAEGHGDAAIALFGKALTHDAELLDALAGLAELLIERGDYERASAFKQKLAHAIGDPNEQFRILVEAGELWAHRAKNLPMAALAFEEALALRPRDHWLLHTLMWAYGQLQCWEKLVETLRAVAGLATEPTLKAKSVYAMALVLRDELNDLPRAAKLLEETLDLDPKRLDAFERVVRVHTELRDWMELKHAYGRMLRRLKHDGDVELRHALFFQLGLIFRDRLGDAARALDAFRAAQRLKPDADDVRKAMIELFIVSDQLGEAITMVRAALKKRPLEAKLYRELYELFCRQRAFDKAWCALDALATLNAPLDAEQGRFYADYPAAALAQIPGTLVPTAWRTHILHGELDPAITKIFALVTPIVLRARSLLAPVKQASLGERLAESNAVAHEVLEAVADGCEILALPPPSLHSRENQPVPLTLAPAKNAIFVSLEACGALPSDALAYVIGKRLAEMRPELAARAACQSKSELKALVVIAVQLSDPRVPTPTTGNAAFDRALVQAITREEKAALRAAINSASAQGSELDVTRWSQLADVSASRVGLLLAGRIEAARRGMLGDGSQFAGDLAPKDKLSELLLFAVSDEHAELRQAIGIGVAANAVA